MPRKSASSSSGSPTVGELSDIEEARRRVAVGKGYIPEHAILTGQWDNGKLVQDALEQVRRERGTGN